MLLEDLLKSPGEWLGGTGPHADIVISSRVRFARNLAGHRFMSKMDADERQEVVDRVRGRIVKAKVVPAERVLQLQSVPRLDLKLLVERHLISKEQEESQHPRAVAIGEGEAVAIMVNEEDHIRLQVLKSGMQLQETLKTATEIDGKLEGGLDYAFSPELGYLTACPTNVGTGLRVSVMLHLPALVLTRHIEKVFQAVNKINLAVRGLYGEGTEASGHFYQISNQVTLGKSEEEVLANVEQVIPTIVNYEKKAREELLKKDRVRLEDRVWRAHGMLCAARVMSSDESMMLLSAVRMGVHLGLLPDVNLATVNELFLFSQPAHLQKLAHKQLEPLQRDVRRAEFIRGKLQGGSK
ncbi:MAG: protein arginine kinase [Planctomycetota bacterium]|nr:protein arginine kinase [Planctomycetota bacterium]